MEIYGVHGVALTQLLWWWLGSYQLASRGWFPRIWHATAWDMFSIFCIPSRNNSVVVWVQHYFWWNWMGIIHACYYWQIKFGYWYRCWLNFTKYWSIGWSINLKVAAPITLLGFNSLTMQVQLLKLQILNFCPVLAPPFPVNYMLAPSHVKLICSYIMLVAD